MLFRSVIGIIAYAWVVKPLGSYSALAGSVALSIMMLPLIVRSTEETLKMLPGSLKELSDGEGYISYRGSSWERVETEQNCNVCLKAYTRNVDSWN